ncbi:MAG: hypothetical protein FWB95_05055 [Treponema sp.]|nr:hypothetical protein [Treponema sp.]
MAGKYKKSIIPYFLIIFVTMFLSCKTVSMPDTADVLRDDATYAPLDTGADVYLFAHAKEARSIIEILPVRELKDKQAKMMLDRTNFITAAVFPEKSGKRFQLAAWGRYPASNAATALNSNKGWEKIKAQTGYEYWYAKSNSLSLALNNRQAFIISTLNRKPAEPAASAPGMEIPEGFNEFRKRAPFSCWVDNPAPVLLKILSEAGFPGRFPVQKLFFNLYPEKDKFEAIIKLQFENITQARAFAAVLGLAGAFVSREPEPASSKKTGMMIVSILLANAPIQNGAAIDLKTAALTADELAVLLNYLLDI